MSAECVCSFLKQCCRQRRTATRLQGGTASAVDGESDSDGNEENSPSDSASVHLYMPVDRGSVDSAGDGTWQNIPLEAPRHPTHVEGASYVQLHYMPPHTRSHRWHVFGDSSDDSYNDEPLVDLGHVSAPAQSSVSASTAEASGVNFPASTCSDRYFHLGTVERGANFRQNSDSDSGQQAACADV